MSKDKLKADTMSEKDLQRLYIYPIQPRDSKIYSDGGFIKIDPGCMGGTHWVALYVKINNLFSLTHLVYNLIKLYSINYQNQ